MNEIKINISGDESLAKNVAEAQKIETSINNAYLDWQKITAKNKNDNLDDSVKSFKKLSDEAEKLAKKTTDLLAIEKLQAQKQAEYIQEQELGLKSLSNYTDNYLKLKKQRLKEEADAQKQAERVEKERIKTTQQLTVEGQKNKIVSQQQTTEIKKQAQNELDLVIIQKKEIKSMADMQAKMSAMNRVRQGLDLSLEKNRVEYDKLTKEINQYNNALKSSDAKAGNFQRNVGNYKSALKGLSSGWLAVTGAIGIGLSVLNQAVSTMMNFVNEYQEGFLAETKLVEILQTRTDATTAQINKIKELTATQQQLGVVEADVQLAGAQQLATFANQSESVDTLIPAMNNLLAQQKGLNATQGDAVNIGNLMGKVLDGNVGALKKVGISFTDAQARIIKYGTEAERAATLAEVINSNVGNMNETLAKTDAGKLQQAKNIIGDFREEIGSYLLPVLASMFQLFLKIINKGKDIVSSFVNMINPVKKLSVEQERYNSFTEESNKIITEERVRIEQLIKVAQNEKRTKEERLAAINSLNTISPEYLGNITLENLETQKTTEAINNYINVLEKKVKAQLSQEKLTDIYTEIYNAEVLIYDQRIKLKEINDKIAGTSDQAQLYGLKNQQQLIGGVVTNFENNITNLEAEKDRYLQILDEMDVNLTGFATPKNRDEDENIDKNIQKVDIYAKKVEEINKDLVKKQYELKQQYKNDSEKVEQELLKYQQLKQIELLQFIDKNKLSDKKIEDELKYIEISEKIKENELNNEKLSLEEKYKIFEEYQNLKKVGFERENLLLEQKNEDENKIEVLKFQQKIQLAEEYLQFLRENNGSEIEIKTVENELLSINNEFAKFINSLKEVAKEDDDWLMKYLGISEEDFKNYTDAYAQLYDAFSSIELQKAQLQLDSHNKKTELLNSEIDNEHKRIEELQGSLDKENELRKNNEENNALLIESQIRASEELILQKNKEQAELIKLKEDEERKIKAIQKQQIWTQFALDNASAISSIIKYAMANPLNGATFGASGLAQIALLTATVTANFIKARQSIKMLEKGEVSIDEGLGTKDDVPALLMRGESVITKDGTKRASNFLRGLNKKVSTDNLISALYKDLNISDLQEYTLQIIAIPQNNSEQNRELRKQNEKLQKNNLYLQKLIDISENQKGYIPTKNGYKIISKNGISTIITE